MKAKKTWRLALIIVMAMLITGIFGVTTAFAEEAVDHTECNLETEYCLVCDVAQRINALPAEADITTANAASVINQINNIDLVKFDLSDAQFNELLELVETKENTSGSDVPDIKRYVEAVEKVKTLTGVDLALTKSFVYADGTPVDASELTNVTVTFKVEAADGSEPTYFTLFDLASVNGAFSTDASFYTASESGWTFNYILPAGEYTVTEVGMTVNGVEAGFDCISTTYGGETHEGNGATVALTESVSLAISNSYHDNYVNGFCAEGSCDCGAYESATYNGGIYEIGNAGQLFWFAEQVNAGANKISAVLTDDIDLENRVWTPIGNATEIDGEDKVSAGYHEGTFDGNGKTISGLNVQADKWNCGLFGAVASAATVKNMTVEGNITVTASNIGNIGLIGFGRNIFVEDIISRVNISFDESLVTITDPTAMRNIGGIVGYDYSLMRISRCAYEGAINLGAHAAQYVGGIIGYINSDSGASANMDYIKDCAFYGRIEGENEAAQYVSGFVGSGNLHCFAISNSLFAGDVNVASTNSVTAFGTYNRINSSASLYYADSSLTAVAGNVASSITPNLVDASVMASGEVAYLLNGSASDGVWGQNIGTDAYPSFTGAAVYQVSNCGGGIEYSNSESEVSHAGYDDNGFCTGCGGYQPAVDSDGDGYYEIGNAGQLYWLAAQVNDNGNTGINAVLTENITVNADVLDENGALIEGDRRAWTPLGSYYTSYAGTFDGAGFTISGLYYNNTAHPYRNAYVGLIGSAASTCVIKDVGVLDSYFMAYDTVGGIAGYSGGTITGCYNTGVVNGQGDNVGGIVGKNQGSITDCYNTGSVSGISSSNYTGGIAGYGDGTITGCYNTGTVSGHNRVGGIVGICWGTVTGCYNTGDVNGKYDLGGIAGFNGKSISSCYNASAVISSVGDTNVGGIAGDNGSSATATDCYYLDDSADGTVAEAKTSAQFASGEVTYLLNGSSSDGVWKQTLDADAYPSFEGGTVYQSQYCDGTENGYLNEYVVVHVGYDDNGFCTGCDGYQPAVDSDEDGYYEIYNGGNLFWFAEQVNAGNNGYNAVLMDDIDLEGREWTPIGNETEQVNSNSGYVPSIYYSGTFDGDGYTISGLYIVPTAHNVGLFGTIGYGATVKNFTLEGSIDLAAGGLNGVGTVAGTSYLTATIENVHSYVSVTEADGVTASANIAGILGAIWGNGWPRVTIDRCSYSGEMTLGDSFENLAGIVGYIWTNNYATITNCGFFGSITTDYVEDDGYDYVLRLGGIIGYVRAGNLKMENCLVTGTLSAPNATAESFVSAFGWIRESNVNNWNHQIGNNYYYGDLPIILYDVTGQSASPIVTYYEADLDGKMNRVTLEQLESGYVTYMLNGGSNDTAEGVWGQEIGYDTQPSLLYGTEDYPVYYYERGNCDAVEIGYTNDYYLTFETVNHVWKPGTVAYVPREDAPHIVDVYCAEHEECVGTITLTINGGVTAGGFYADNSPIYHDLKVEGMAMGMTLAESVTISFSSDSTDGVDGTWTTLTDAAPLMNAAGWYKVVLNMTEEANTETALLALEPANGAVFTYTFYAAEQKDLELEGSIGDGDENTEGTQIGVGDGTSTLIDSTVLGKPVLSLANGTDKLQFIANYAITLNDGISSLLLVPDFDSDLFRIAGISVNGQLCTWEDLLGSAGSTEILAGWEVTFTGNEADYDYFKFELDHPFGDGHESTATGGVFIQIIYETVDGASVTTGHYTFGFDTELSKAYSTVFEDGMTVAQYTEVTISVIDAVLDIIVREDGEITIDPDQSLVYDGEEVGAEDASQNPDTNEYVVFVYNGFTYTVPAEMIPADAEIDWAAFWKSQLVIEWYDAAGTTKLDAAPTEVGTYTLKISAKENEFLNAVEVVSQTFTITPYVIDETVTIDPTEKPYTGEEQPWEEGDVTISDVVTDYLKVDEERYTFDSISIDKTPIDVDTYVVTVIYNAAANYAFDVDGAASASKTFTFEVKITPIDVVITAKPQGTQYSDPIFDFSGVDGDMINSSVLEQLLADIAAGKLEIILTTDATSDSDVGTYTIYIEVNELDGNDNYGTFTLVDGVYTISRKVIEVPEFEEIFNYNGLEQGYEQPEQVNGKDAYSYEGNKGVDAQKYTLTATLASDNYVWADYAGGSNADVLERTFEWEILAAALEVTIGDYTAIYEGLYPELLGEAIGLQNGEELKDLIASGDIVYTIVGAEYSTDGNNYLLVGEYAITGEDNSQNYDITFIDGTYVVTAKELADSLEELLAMITGSIKEYSGSTVTWEDGDFTFDYWADLLTITNAAPIDGTDYVNANGTGTTLEAWAYYDENGKLYYTVTVTLNDTRNYVLYNGVGEGVTTLEGAEVEVFIRQADNLWISEPEVKDTDTSDGLNDILNIFTDYEAKFGALYGDPSDTAVVKYYVDPECTTEIDIADMEAGTTYYVKVTVEATDNYAGIDHVGGFSVEMGTVTIPVVKVDNADGAVVAPNGESAVVIYDGVKHILVIPAGNGAYTVELTPNEDWINAGEYTATLTLNPNYTWDDGTEIPLVYTLTIRRRAITITAEDKEITYGDAAPDYTVKVDNMAAGEELADLLGTDYETLLSCGYAQGNDAGDYPITITMTKEALEAILTNYEVTPVDGTLTVKKAVINIESILGALDKDPEDTDTWESLKASGATVEYNSETHEIKVILPDNANVTVTVWYTDVDGNATTDGPENAGKYTVTLDIVANDTTNYEVSWTDEDKANNAVTLEITRVQLVITTNDVNHTFNGEYVPVPSLTEEELKALISRYDDQAVADFIYDEVIISGLYFLENPSDAGGYMHAGDTSTTYGDVVYATHSFDSTNYEIAEYVYGDVVITIEWHYVGAQDRPYDGTAVAPGGSVGAPDDILAVIENYITLGGSAGGSIGYTYTREDGESVDAAINIGTYNITAKYVSADGLSWATSEVFTITITQADLNVTVDDVIKNYLQDYTVNPGATTIEGDGFTPVFYIEFFVNDAWTTDAPINVGEYDIRVSVTNTENSNYTAAEYTNATLTINKAALNGVTFDYEADKATWSRILESTDGELINKHGYVNVIYTVTNGEFTYVTDDLEAVYEFVADREGVYTLTATVEDGDDSFIESVTETVSAYSITFTDGEHSKNTEYQGEIDDYLTTIGTNGVQYRFDGQTAAEPDPYYGTTFEGYDFNGWLLGDESYDFGTPVTDNITLKIDWKIWTFNVTWYDANGDVITTTVVAWHDNPVYDETLYGTPTKDSDAMWNYTFDGWTDAVYDWEWSYKLDLEEIFVDGDMNLYAYFSTEGVTYTVIFKVWDKDFDNGDGTFGAYVEKMTVLDAQYGDELTLDKYYQLTEVTWFRPDAWYTDETRWDWTATVPTPEEGANGVITLYGAYVFDIGTGDVNADGVVDADDITLYRQWVVGGYTMNVVTAENADEIWDYVQNGDYAAALENSNIFFITLVADANEDSSEDIRDITTIRMAIVGNYGYYIVNGIYVSGDAVTTEYFEAEGPNTDITYEVEAVEGEVEVTPYGNEEIITILKTSVDEIRIWLNMTPVNYDSSAFTFTATDGHNGYADVSDKITLEYVLDEDQNAYISIKGFEYADSFAYFVSFDMDGDEWYFGEYFYRVLYEAPEASGLIYDVIEADHLDITNETDSFSQVSIDNSNGENTVQIQLREDVRENVNVDAISHYAEAFNGSTLLNEDYTDYTFAYGAETGIITVTVGQTYLSSTDFDELYIYIDLDGSDGENFENYSMLIWG